MGEAATGQGSNSATIRQYNERVILTALRRMGEASKAELARRVNLTQNAAGQIVKELQQQRLVRTAGKRTGARGQPATLMTLDPGGAYAIGVEIGRRSSDSILLDFSGRVLLSRHAERSLPMPDAVVRAVRDDVAALRAAIPAPSRHRLVGIGVAVPYNLGSWRRELDIPDDVCAAWNGFDLLPALRTALDVPVMGENDGTAVAVAELFGGLGRELDDFAVVFIGAAVGGGLVLNGAYRRGVTGNAGDIGLMTVPPSRLPTAPRPARPHPGENSDILLNRASVAALLRHLRLPRSATEAELDAAVSAKPRLAAEWLEDCADALVGPVLSIGSLLDLQAVVVDGNLPRPMAARLVERLRAGLAEHAPEARPPPRLLLGTAGRHAPATGAAMLPLHVDYGADRDRLFGT